MKTRNRPALKALMSGVAAACLMGVSAVAQVQMPAPNVHIGSPDLQLGAQLHRVQQSAEERQFYMQVQTYLQVLGFYRGGIDGVWGPGSDRALSEFLQMAGQSGWSQEAYDVLRAAAARYERGGISVGEAIRNPTNPDEEALEVAAQQIQQAMEAFGAGDYGTASRLFEAALVVAERVLGPEHPYTLLTRNDLAASLSEQGRYAEAEALQRELLAVQERVLGPEHPSTLITRGNLASSLRNLGRHAEAEALERELLAVRERVLGPEHPSTLITRGNLASSLRNLGRYAEAEALSRELLTVQERVLGSEHPDTLTTRDNLASSLRNLGRYAEAEALQRELLAVLERVRGPEHPDTLATRGNLASSLHNLGRSAEAEALSRELLTVQERVLGSEHPDTLTTRDNIGVSLLGQGRYAEAEAFQRELLAVRERVLGSEHPDTLPTQYALALSLLAQGRFAEAEALQRELLAVRERVLGSEHPDTLRTRNALAASLSEQGRYAEAEALQRELLTVRERVLGPEHPSTLTTRSNLAVDLSRQGRYAEAEALSRELLTVQERVLGPEHPSTLATRGNLASSLHNLGRSAEAEALSRELLTVQERVLGSEHPSTLRTRGNIGASLFRQGRYAEAEALERELLAVSERVLGPEHPGTLTTRTNIGASLVLQGRFAEAEALLRELLTVRERVLGPEHPDTLSTRDNIGLSLAEQGQFVEALLVIEEGFTSISAAVSERGEGGLILPRYLDLAWTGEGLDPVATASRTFPAQGYLTYGSLDVASGALAARAQADEGVDILRQFQDASEEVQRLRRAYLAAYEPTSTVPELARERILQDMRAAQDTFAEVSARLERDFPALAEIELPRALSAEEAQELLEPGEGLLAYASTDDHLYAWLITPDRVDWVRMDVSAADLSERVARLREGLDQSVTPSAAIADGCAVSDAEGYWNSFDICAAQELHDLVLGQIDLTGIDELLVVPDGALETIPFSVLVSDIESDGSPQWLVEDHAITTLPATSSLRALRLYSTAEELELDNRQPFLGVAPVTFSGTRDDSPLRGASIPDLPSTDDEVQLLSAFLGAGEEGVVLEDAATEHFVRTADLDQYRVLSFATHGFLSRETSEYTDGAVNEMALALRSGQGEDGLLTSSEAATLRLNADWVLLSACNTAAGEGGDDAEGLSGLARAFFYAGAETLLVSHWPIDDQATPTLLTDVMLRSQSEDISRAQSLRQAQLAMLSQSQYAHPFYWAPFSVVGDNR